MGTVTVQVVCVGGGGPEYVNIVSFFTFMVFLFSPCRDPWRILHTSIMSHLFIRSEVFRSEGTFVDVLFALAKANLCR